MATLSTRNSVFFLPSPWPSCSLYGRFVEEGVTAGTGLLESIGRKASIENSGVELDRERWDPLCETRGLSCEEESELPAY